MSEEKNEDLETSTEIQENEEEASNEEETSSESEELSTREKQLLARAKKAEAKLKEANAKKPNKSNTESSLTRQEAILYAKGYTDDEVELANKLSKLEDISVLEAIEDPVFKTKYEERIKKEKAEQASLGASTGPGHSKPDKPVKEMTKEEHMNFFNKVVNS